MFHSETVYVLFSLLICVILFFPCYQFLSMKLATVNPRLDFNIEGLLAKDVSELVHISVLHNSVWMLGSLLRLLIFRSLCRSFSHELVLHLLWAFPQICLWLILHCIHPNQDSCNLLFLVWEALLTYFGELLIPSWHPYLEDLRILLRYLSLDHHKGSVKVLIHEGIWGISNLAPCSSSFLVFFGWMFLLFLLFEISLYMVTTHEWDVIHILIWEVWI